MGIRTLSGAVYVLITVLFFLLREFVSDYFFYLYIAILSALGTIEVSRAVGYGERDFSFYFTMAFGIILVPVFVLFQKTLKLGAIVCFLLVNVLALVFTIISKKKNTYVNEGEVNVYSSRIIALYYPSVFILFMCLLCTFHGDAPLTALVLLFVISPLTDTMAYLVGMVYNKIRKGKAKKLCPKLSPKKTIAGAIGGLFGGVLGAILVLLIFKPRLALNYPWLFFIIVGALGSLFTQIGDLFESYIKRSVGIKDMGKLIPGHGGIMDRIDGMCFCSVVLYFAFLII